MRVALMSLLASLVWAGSASAWDATTRLTNVPITNDDVGAILTDTITAAFDEAFPPPRYSIHVMVDSISLRNGQDSVYLSIGLARRTADGQHLQQHANVSAALLRPGGEASEARREAIIRSLAELSDNFAKLLPPNAQKLR